MKSAAARRRAPSLAPAPAQVIDLRVALLQALQPDEETSIGKLFQRAMRTGFRTAVDLVDSLDALVEGAYVERVGNLPKYRLTRRGLLIRGAQRSKLLDLLDARPALWTPPVNIGTNLYRRAPFGGGSFFVAAIHLGQTDISSFVRMAPRHPGIGEIRWYDGRELGVHFVL